MLMEIVLTLLINFVAVSELVLVWRGDKRASLLMAFVAGWGAFAGVFFLLWQLLCSSDPAFRSLADLTATH
jgi:tryptophan-rich sensory protein